MCRFLFTGLYAYFSCVSKFDEDVTLVEFVCTEFTYRGRSFLWTSCTMFTLSPNEKTASLAHWNRQLDGYIIIMLNCPPIFRSKQVSQQLQFLQRSQGSDEAARHDRMEPSTALHLTTRCNT